MECTWDAALLRKGDQLPTELLQIIQHGSNEQYLELFTRTALDARYTYILLAHCEDLFAHICASLRSEGSFASTIATLGRVVPHAPYLAPFAIHLLENESYTLGQASDDEEDLLYLLGLSRLLKTNFRVFGRYVNTTHLWSLLRSSRRPVTYLIIRILQIQLKCADRWLEVTLKRYLGEGDPLVTIEGSWDETTVDYRFLSLLEQKRRVDIQNMVRDVGKAALKQSAQKYRVIPPQLFHSATSFIGGILLPSTTAAAITTRKGTLVETETTVRNLRVVARALKQPGPLLLTGLAGSGKTLLVQHAAQSLGKLDTMVTLHLNEQSDAKMLLGVHTTGEVPGTFTWKPGVLTTAVQEGRWVLIEDLDKAPNEVLGTLLPLIEKRELSIPNRKDTVYAAEGFRILATVRSTVNHQGEESKPLAHMVGSRHWQKLSIAMPTVSELAIIVESLYPSLGKSVPQFMAVYERLTSTKQQAKSEGQSKTGVARAISPRDLLKWCKRMASIWSGRSSFPSNYMDDAFLEAVDTFLGPLPDDDVRGGLAAGIARELHIDENKRDHLLRKREVPYKATKEKISSGRYTIPRTRQMRIVEGSFSTNPHTCRTLECVMGAVVNREPLLLVGETGVGKTTAVQHLATQLGKKIVPFNLSQQTEAGDLLGGFKPVNPRTLMLPLKDEFDDLFHDSFSSLKNEKFIALLKRTADRNDWARVCKLFRTAIDMVNQERAVTPPREEGEAPSKKRKTGTKRVIDFGKWDAFLARVEAMEIRLTSADKAVAFTFIEGNIVKAVRNGDWVLLDEINLASSDTLESIVDLLDAAPSLLLTEAGNIERVDANPDFRVFAAMNPATDVGKKDLPPGIRSRFTELYVESPDKDAKSLESIVRSWLGAAAADSDLAVASDVRKLYQKILLLTQDNKLVDGAGQKPHFSLRTLTRTLSYAKQIQQTCSLRRALYEGFQMSFLTSLDAESAALVQPHIQDYLFKKKTKVETELKRPLGKPEDSQATYVQGHPGSKHWIRKGAEQLQDQPQYIITSFVGRNLENLVRAASTRQFPVLIQGPTSAGKTSMIEYLAQRTGHKFTRINNHEHTDLQEYLGTYESGADGRLQFQEGVLVKALREGHWIVLDELNLAPTDVLEALNRLLDDNRELLIPETQETIRPHPDFMLFATQNPAGLYGGRKTLSRAFRNRFLELHFDDIPINELQEILARRTQLAPPWCAHIVNVYRELSTLRQQNRLFEQKSFATLRDLFRWALRPSDNAQQLAENGYMVLCERVRNPDERVALKAIIEKAIPMASTIDEDALYSAACPEVQQHKEQATDHGVVWTKAMRRLYVLVHRAIANNEPVLLVGETGCGKTTVCQMLADALKTALHTVNAHQNTETGDLIGSQRPLRNRGAIEAELRQRLLAAPVLQTLPNLQELSAEQLLSAYDQAMKTLSKEQRVVYQSDPDHLEIQACRTSFKRLFEWVDGSLVQAMRRGELFLLDEISLADDSVLERINSVLESSRTILLAEKGSLDSSIVAAPGFQFFATMNPGGDYGKRELSPALRNRFTEIWVPSMSDMDDVLQIVKSKLAAVARPHAKAMIEFASWFKARFDTSASSAVSIRDTLAWIQFVNAYERGDVIPAIVHGAAMVYIDTLGANPAGLMSMSSTSIAEERSACFAELGRLLTVDARSSYGNTFEVRRTPGNFSIGPFALECVPGTSATEVTFTFDPPTTRSNAMRVLRALQLPKAVLLEGSPGVGKTALVTAIAAAIGMPLTRINLSDQTDLIDLFGSDAPVEDGFGWRDAPFLRAMKNGEWVLLDEMNLASQSVLEGLNACLDHRGEVFVPELGLSFARHPRFRLFAAQNPHHQGGGRKGLPASFVNRFTVVYADTFKAEDLMMICERSFPDLSPEYIAKAVTFVTELNNEVAERRSFGSNGGPWEFNLRDITRWLALASSTEGLLSAGTPRDFVNMLFVQRFRTSHDKISVDKLFTGIFEGPQHATDLYCSLSPETLQIGLALLPRDDLTAMPLSEASSFRFSSQQLRAIQTVMLCVHKAWPVILAGGPGVGKTATLEQLAACVGAEIVTLGMSAETDALDLIGGYEQHDPHRRRAQALSILRSLRDQSSKVALAEGSADQSAILHAAFVDAEHDASDAALSRLARLLPPRLRAELLPVLEELRNASQAIDKARFEWIDGPLIEAIQEGKWVILDNANLCSPSVLDRLNGLMEPNGVLIVNEHCAPDGSAQVITPHAGFRIFMTVDPRLGDLSRAMRNRAVEIHLDVPDEAANASTGILQSESAMTRFGIMQQLITDDTATEHMCAVAQDHLGLSDLMLLSRFQSQQSTARNRQLALEDSSAYVSRNADSQALYQRVTSALQAPADFARVQTVHPLNNQPLVQQSQQVFAVAVSLAARYDIAAQFSTLSNAMATLKADRKLSDRLARTWNEAQRQANAGSVGPKPKLLDILENLLLPIRAWLGQAKHLPPDEIHATKKITGSLIAYCRTLLRTLTSPALDIPLLTATAIVGQSLCHTSAVPTVLDSTIAQFQVNLSELGLISDTQARHAFVAMWQKFRPIMPKTMETLQALLHFEDVIAQFDSSTLSFYLPLKEIAKLRVDFQLALSTNSSAEDLNSLAEQALASLPVSTEDFNLIDNAVTISPHFADSAEALYQRFVIAMFDTSDWTSLEILSSRKTVHGILTSERGSDGPVQLVLGRLGLLSSPGVGDASVMPIDGLASTEKIIGGVATVGEVKLQALDLLETEAKTLGHAIAVHAQTIEVDPLSDLNTLMRSLLDIVLETLATNNELGLLKEYASDLSVALQAGDATHVSLPHDADQRTAAICQRLTDVAIYLSTSAGRAEQKRQSAANAWCALASASLDLYVPKHAFDPVQESRIHTEVFQYTQSDLKARLAALQSFRKAWVGEQESLRSRLLQEDIEELGEGPAKVEICRPSQSKLSQLHGDLQALARIVEPLRHNPSAQTLNAGAWSNLRVIRDRLHSQYRAYADLAAPVVGFIDCLLVAQRLVLSTGREVQHQDASLANITPFFDAGSKDWLSDERFVEVQHTCRSMEEQIFWLSAIAARSSIVPVSKASPALRSTINNTLRLFYEAWTKELDRDQRIAARNSSLYQYRGVDDESEEATSAELNELFPSYDSESDGATPSSRVNAQTLASRMAVVHHSIHSETDLSPHILLELLRQASQVPSSRTTSNTVAMINALHKLASSLAYPQKSKNVYTDPDIGQAKTLVALLDKITKRFKYIHHEWPDHATPIEALRACNTILALSHSEPLARFLPFVEKLHNIVNEWQKVASSQYSVLDLLNEITSLIVSWRQLELSTWAGLFDHEDEACKQSASSWWYIAYETIVAAAEDEVQSGHALTTFSQQLLETLGGFLTNCGLGEFRIRLSMLVDFEADLTSRVIDNAALTPVRNALASLIEFYAHFTSSVASHWATKRADLEKQIKEVVLLASWKDVNIEAMRRSAKNSHNKLLRSVKKYRMLLAEPVAPLLQSEFPAIRQRPHHQLLRIEGVTPIQDLPVVPSKAWSMRPQGLKDLVAVANEIGSNPAWISTAGKASERLEKFLLETNEEAAELRKATPSTATDKNKGIVQQLKSRKRRLLADVFRDVQAMGFQKNLGDDVLAQQQSLHGVLSKSPPLHSPKSIVDAFTADYEHHRFAHLMPTVRASTSKHNEDLTPAEIARGRTLLESMLQITTQQRSTLSERLADLTSFAIAVNQLTEMSKVGNVRIDNSNDSGHGMFGAQLRGLLVIVKTTTQCVLMQSGLAMSDFSDTKDELTAICDRLHELDKVLISQIGLPARLTTHVTRELTQKYDNAVVSLHSAVKKAISLHPELGPLLAHVLRWTSPHSSNAAYSGTQPLNADTWVQRLIDVVDKVRSRATPQQMSDNNGEPKKAWLLDQQRRLQNAVQALEIRSTCIDLEEIIASLPFVQSSDQHLDQIAVVCADTQPVLAAYATSAQKMLTALCKLHATTNKVAYHMGTSFVQLAREGFCTPSDKAQGEEQQSGEVESGTGLGDGEGGDDISKDIGADEDLSELAQEAISKEQEGEMDAEKDAVDMADEDLQGQFDEDAGPDGEEQEEGNDDGEDAELDEETGHIGENDDAIDEKTWDDGKKAEEADKEADKGKGTRNDDQAGAENADAGEQADGEEAEGEEMEEDTETGAEMDTEVGQQEPDQADPHMQEQENLDLPDDLQMDGDKQDMSDIDEGDDMPDDLSEIGGMEEETRGKEDLDNLDDEMVEGECDEQDEKTGEATAPEEEDTAQQDENGEDANSDVAMLDNEEAQEKPDDALTAADAGQGHEEDSDAAKESGAVSSVEQQDDDHDANETSEQSGATEGTQRTQTNDAAGQAETGDEQQQSLPFKQLGDVLKQWYNQHRNIEAAQEPQDQNDAAQEDVDTNDPRFEHLPENADSDMQALGAASAEQSKALDEQNAVDVSEHTPDDVPLPEEMPDAPLENEPEEDAEATGAKGEGVDGGVKPNQTVVGKPMDLDTPMHDQADLEDPDDIEDVDQQLTETHLSREEPELMSTESARQAWSEHENRTRNMAIVLTEHLRLILQPTQATKMRGDFRTGKRLNIKKIIPYIASSYKRDKIWMRRSVPSKRTYQIMLAIDDSESMNENERKGLAFDTLALLAKSMAMLEVGELSVLGFGETANVAHGFDMPFTSDAGAEVIRQLTFSQTKTDVKRLLEKSIELFRNARLKATGSASKLWQLQLIISDGMCSDHPSIRQLIRQAHEEQIMVVFIVIDAAAQETTVASGSKQSILDLQFAEMGTAPNGEPQVHIRKYMDTFPFRYYLIVRDVLELPSVLAGALRQWFAEVVGSDG